jgi:glycosyltransferase involved in cell wall biosynthesis
MSGLDPAASRRDGGGARAAEERASRPARCALFQTEWPLQSHTENTVRCLAKAGIAVDLFVSQCHTYIDLGGLAQLPGVTVHDLTPAVEATWSDRSSASWKRRAVKSLPAGDRLYDLLLPRWLLLRGSHDDLLPPVLDRAVERIHPDTRCLIGIEKHGLIWAGRVADRLCLPLVYLNLELYVDDFVREIVHGDVRFRRLRAAERHYHRRARATIVQDEDRAARLLHDNGVDVRDREVFHVPCGALGDERRDRSTWLQDRLGLPREQKVMLYFGQLHEQRFSLALAEAAQAFPEDWTLVLHGWGPEETIERIRGIDAAGRVRLSLGLVPPGEILDVIASATAGFALYAATPWNDQLTACASEKMAYYAQCGVPFVAFDYPNYRKVLADAKWGVLVGDSREIPRALAPLVREHRTFREEAFRAFRLYYDFERRFAPVTAWVAGLPPVDGLETRRVASSEPELALREPPERWSPPPWIRGS